MKTCGKPNRNPHTFLTRQAIYRPCKMATLYTYTNSYHCAIKGSRARALLIPSRTASLRASPSFQVLLVTSTQDVRIGPRPPRRHAGRGSERRQSPPRLEPRNSCRRAQATLHTFAFIRAARTTTCYANASSPRAYAVLMAGEGALPSGRGRSNLGDEILTQLVVGSRHLMGCPRCMAKRAACVQCLHGYGTLIRVTDTSQNRLTTDSERVPQRLGQGRKRGRGNQLLLH
jgi:hypothetical protein